jgi:hypothetical protein
MIDMRDDAEVSGQLDRHKAVHYAGARRVGQLVVPLPRARARDRCASHSPSPGFGVASSEAATEELHSRAL